MPLSPAQRRKLSAAKIENSISLSNAEKTARSTAKKEAREAQKETEESVVPAWAITLLAIAVFGSVIAQLYFNIVNAPAGAFGGAEENAAAAGEQ